MMLERVAARLLLVLPPQIYRPHLKLLLPPRSPPLLAGEGEVVSSCSSTSSCGPGSRGNPQGGHSCRVRPSPEPQVVVVGQSVCRHARLMPPRAAHGALPEGAVSSRRRSARPPPQGRHRNKETRRLGTHRWPSVGVVIPDLAGTCSPTLHATHHSTLSTFTATLRD